MQQVQHLLKDQLQLFHQLVLQVVVQVDLETVLIQVQQLQEEMVDLVEAVTAIQPLLVDVVQEQEIHLQQLQHKEQMEEQPRYRVVQL
tara:strand:+ start:225 stop:488 length:264 start_codon:yes stop_codon:yes gene_type:complete